MTPSQRRPGVTIPLRHQSDSQLTRREGFQASSSCQWTDYQLVLLGRASESRVAGTLFAGMYYAACLPESAPFAVFAFAFNYTYTGSLRIRSLALALLDLCPVRPDAPRTSRLNLP